MPKKPNLYPFQSPCPEAGNQFPLAYSSLLSFIYYVHCNLQTSPIARLPLQGPAHKTQPDPDHIIHLSTRLPVGSTSICPARLSACPPQGARTISSHSAHPTTSITSQSQPRHLARRLLSSSPRHPSLLEIREGSSCSIRCVSLLHPPSHEEPNKRVYPYTIPAAVPAPDDYRLYHTISLSCSGEAPGD